MVYYVATMVNKCVVVGCDYNYEKRRKRDAVGNLLPTVGCSKQTSQKIMKYFIITSGLNLLAEKSGNSQITQ